MLVGEVLEMEMVLAGSEDWRMLKKSSYTVRCWPVLGFPPGSSDGSLGDEVVVKGAFEVDATARGMNRCAEEDARGSARSRLCVGTLIAASDGV